MGVDLGLARIAVLCDGKLTGILEDNDITSTNIMRLATQFE